MIRNFDSMWRKNLGEHLKMPATRHRDILLAEDSEFEFNPLDLENAMALLHVFSFGIDPSVLQSFEGALGKMDRFVYFDALGRCFQSLFDFNKRIAVERINYPGQIPESDMFRCFCNFSQHLSPTLLGEMRNAIIEWRLRATEPYSSFFQYSLQYGVVNG